MQEIALNPTSYIVLGLIELAGEATSYDLKQGVNQTLGNFWSMQHAQLYSEPERLAGAGYLTQRREESGRRRKHYSITAKGTEALAQWRATPADRTYELRDPSLLKLFFGADPAAIAEAQIDAHRSRLAEYERMASLDSGSGPRGPWLTLEAGIGHERQSIRFWEGVRARGSG